MMAARWGGVDRGLANARRHFAVAIEGFAGARGARDDKDRHFRRGASMHAMMAGHTSFENAIFENAIFENAVKDYMGLLGEPLPIGHGWHRRLVERLAAPVAGQRPSSTTEA